MRQMSDMPPEALESVVRVWQMILAELHPDVGTIRVTPEVKRHRTPVLRAATRQIDRLAAEDHADTFVDRRRAA